MQSMVSVPLTLGTGFSGKVVEEGQDITHVKPGDSVYGTAFLVLPPHCCQPKELLPGLVFLRRQRRIKGDFLKPLMVEQLL